nr:zinc finger protein isoform X3 [Ciona intestinalis]|eukprot:XP_018671156.1 zinc finger protein isoform X3 [Ciona intestinalis]
MSSRRKSRPVRRVESEHPGNHAENFDTVTQSVDEQYSGIQTLISRNSVHADEEYQNNTDQEHADAYSNGAETRDSEQAERNDEERPIKRYTAYENPPEGVYVLQPQGFSDDETPDSNAQPAYHPNEENPHMDSQTDRKRMRDGDNSATECEQDEERGAGLDLTVKRRRTHSTEEADAMHTDNTDCVVTDDKMKRFERLLQLLALRRPLAEAMEEVGLSRDEVAKVHRTKLQMLENKRQDMINNIESTSEVNQVQPEQQRPEWEPHNQHAEAWTGEPAETRVTAFEGGHGIPKPFPANIPPAAVAAMMASIVSNSERSRVEGTDALQKIFKRSQSFFNQSPTMANAVTPPTARYSTSADAMDTITAGTVSSGVGSIKKGTLDPMNFDEDVFDKYITKFTAKNSCMQSSCPHINRDHFHCTDSDCNFQRFTNKSDVIRHYNMHKKRDNSLAHGFMRFAPTDDCTSQFGNCHLNGKSTHYHCLYTSCTKVYTSTSDVMTHENFHKKNQQFVSNGFQRYRATESCGMQDCPFIMQRTTHFHCTRPDCNFTFKNKCDIEKHKAYHMRDDAYARQGFKKFYKNESCKFPSCTWNRTANHFHCLRRNCDFAFTSTSQMVSHKRKHDRHDLMGTDGATSTPTTNAPTTTTCPASISLFPRATVAVPSAPNVTPLSSLVRSPSVHPYMVTPGNRPPNFVLPFFSPFVAASFLNRPAAPVLFEQRNGNLTSAFKEAAKKVLASIPSSVAAAALPRNLAAFSPKTEQYQAYLPTSAAISPTLPGHDGSFPRREDQQREAMTSTSPGVMSTQSNSSYERPPPTYVEATEQQPINNSPNYEQFNGDQSNQQESWHERGISPNAESSWQQQQRTHAEQIEYSETNTTQQKQQDGGRVLNLSSRSGSSNENYNKEENNQTALEISNTPSPSVLKYFRGLGPDECPISNCMFHNQYHFHCAVQDCCAVFTERLPVLNHTKFHEKLDHAGVDQPISPSFPIYPALQDKPNNSRSGDDGSPPPGYIALSVTKRPENRPEPAPEVAPIAQIAPRNIVLSRSGYEGTTSTVTNSNESVNEERKQAMYNYISQMVADKKPANFFQNYPRPGDAVNTGAFAMLQNSIIANIVSNQAARTSIATVPTPNNIPIPSTAAFDGQSNQAKANSRFSEEGFLHVRPGMSCTRQDCKYLNQNHWHCTLNRCRYVCKSLGKAQSHRQAHDSLEGYARSAKEWFRSYTVKKNCPNPNCEFRLRGHYHCLKPGCQFVTIGTSKLPWHMKKHEKIARREASGFKYYTKKEQCAKFGCKYNGLFSHYHCIRADCEFAFQYKHQMSTHVRKHLRRMLGRSYHGRDLHTNSTVADIDHSNVDSGDDSLPLIVDEADEIEQRPGDATERDEHDYGYKHQANPTTELTQQQLAVLDQISRGVKAAQMNQSDVGATEPSSPDLNNSTFNDDDDDDTSSDEVLDLTAGASHLDMDSNSVGSSSNNEYGTDIGNTADDEGQHMMQTNEQIIPTTPVTSEFSAHKTPEPANSSAGSVFAKFRLNNDVMEGFKRFESSENCGDTMCTYMFKVAHFHCIRDDCNYRFTGRTHMFKHHQHHERVAGLVRDDFKRIKTTQDCAFDGCPYKGNSTHFHCLRCPFKCTDSAKVGTHRRQHVKADTLEQSGFERFRGKEDCMRENCKYRDRNTSHFHCLQDGCSYTVVGLSGIEQHANKHKRNNILAQVCSTMSQETVYKPFINPNMGEMHSFPTSHSRQETYAPVFVPPVVPFVQRSDAPSPVTDDHSSVSPAYSAVTAHFDPRYLQVQSAGGGMELAGSLNLSVNQQDRGVASTASLSSVPAGVGSL